MDKAGFSDDRSQTSTAGLVDLRPSRHLVDPASFLGEPLANRPDGHST